MDTKPELLRPGLFRDRREAGRLLAAKLAKYGGRPDVIVLALPRGGVPVAYEVASALGASLDVFVVRKLGVPGYEELAMGATMHAAIQALRQQQPARIVVAVPTASPETCEEMRAEVDDVICAITPAPFHAVGL